MNVKDMYELYKNNANPKVVSEIIERIVGSEKIGKRSQFKLNEFTTSFSISPTTDKISCRQYYTDSNGLLTFVIDQNKFLYFDQEDLVVSEKATRYTSNGVPAYNAHVHSAKSYNKKVTNRFNKILKNML